MNRIKKMIFIILLLILTSLLYFELKTSTKKNIIYPEFDTYGQTIYLPTYIPKGYIVDDINIEDGIITTRFVCGTDYIFFIQMNYSNAVVDVDNTNYETNRIKLADKEGYFSKEYEETIFTYYEGDYSFTISGNLDRDEISKIVNSTEIYK